MLKPGLQYRNAFLISSIYLIFGILWIFLTDKIIFSIVEDGHSLTQIQTYKGWGFVLFTSFLLFFLVYTFDARLLITIKLLKDSNKDLKIFIYHISHELRAPISTSLGLLHLAKSEVEEKKSLFYLEKLEKISLNADKTIHELIRLSNLINGEIHKSEVNFKDLIGEILTETDFMNGYERIKFRINVESEKVNSDRGFLKIVLLNLIENAIKYADPEKSESVIEINVKKVDKSCLIEVSDNGMGIEPLVKEKIFQIFYRGTNVSQGSGLGLYIVKLALQRLNGTIKVESINNEGSSFTIILPNF